MKRKSRNVHAHNTIRHGYEAKVINESLKNTDLIEGKDRGLLTIENNNSINVSSMNDGRKRH